MRVSKDPLYLWRHDRKRKKEIGKINDIEGGEEKKKEKKKIETWKDTQQKPQVISKPLALPLCQKTDSR